MLETVKCLVLNGTEVKTFNTNNRWVSLGTIPLTASLFTDSGFLYNNLTVPLSYIYLLYTQTSTLDDGTIVYQSDEITSNMGITKLEEVTVDTVVKLKATVPTFLIKDGISPTDVIYYYTTDGTFMPYVNGVTFSQTVTHDTNISFIIDTIYNYNENIKYRFKVNSRAFSAWSTAIPAYNKLTGQIDTTSLSLGTNNLVFEISNEAGTKVTTYNMTSAIEVVNDTPQILIVNADSNSFKLHFKIMDSNITDTLSYRLLITNTLYNNEILQDWSVPYIQPIENVYYIDTSKIVPDDTNIITIEYKDNYMGTIQSATYSFMGKYKNILFIDELGNYYTTDKGVILKILDLKSMVAGQESEIKSIVIRNNSIGPITDLNIDTTYSSPVTGTTLQLSKTNNPFIGSASLDYGQEVIESGIDKRIYVKLNTTYESEGICVFDIIATGTIV